MSLLVSKPEIKALAAFILGRGEVVQTLFLAHSVPAGITRLVPPHVVDLGQDVNTNVTAGNREQLAVTTAVERCIVGAVNVGRDNTTSLDDHVVAGS